MIILLKKQEEKTMKKLLKSSLMVATIIGAMFSGSVFAAGKAEYIKMEEKAIKSVFTEMKKIAESDVTKILLPVTEKVRKDSEAKILVNIDDPDLAEIKNITSKTTLEYDIENNNYYIDFKSSLNDENILSLNGSMTEKDLLLIIPELMDEYLYMDFSQREEFKEFYEEYEKSKELEKALELTDSEKNLVNKSFLNYYNVIKNSLPESAFTMRKDVEMTYNNKTIKCNMVEMRISEADLKPVVINLLKEIKNDEKLLDLALDKFYKFMESQDAINSEIYRETMNKKAFIVYIDSMIADLDTYEPSTDTLFVVRNYFDKSFNVLQREFVDPYTDGVYFTLTTVPNEYYGVKYCQERIVGWNTDYFIPENNRKIYKREEINLNIQVVKEGDKTKYLLDLGNWTEGPEATFELDKKNKVLTGETFISDAKVTFETKLNNKSSKKTLDTLIKVDSAYFDIEANIKDSMQKIDKINKINLKNKKDITNYTEEQLEAVLIEIGNRLEQKEIDDMEGVAVGVAAMVSVPEVRGITTVMVPSVVIPMVNYTSMSMNDMRTTAIELQSENIDLITPIY